MGRDTFIDWQLGTQSAFDEARFPGWSTDDLLCRRPGVAPLSAWSRHVAPHGQRTRVDEAQSPSARFKQLSNTEKLGVALRSTARSVGPEVGGKLQELISPTNLAIMAGALAIWVGAHATPIGWVVDIGMVGLGVVALGAEAIKVMRELHAFAMGVIKAQSEADLIAAGQHLAKAIAIVGVDVVVAILLKKAIVKVRQPTPRGGEVASETKLFGKYDPNDAARSLPAERPRPVIEKPSTSEPVAGSAKTAAINTQKQAGHIPGTPQNVNRIKQGKPTSSFYGEKSGEMATRIAQERGTPVPGRPNVKEYDFKVSVGTGPNGGSQTKVRVHQSPKTGEIHGHPSGPERF